MTFNNDERYAYVDENMHAEQNLANDFERAYNNYKLDRGRPVTEVKFSITLSPCAALCTPQLLKIRNNMKYSGVTSWTIVYGEIYRGRGDSEREKSIKAIDQLKTLFTVTGK